MEFVVEHDGCGLHVTKRGSGPVLLLIHGAVCDGNYFEAAGRYLSGNFTVITYDRRGYSKSSVPENADFSVEKQAEDAVSILDALDCGAAFVAGSSAGGLVALELARKYPDKVKKLFLHETPLGVEEPFRGEIGQWLLKLREAADKGKMAKALLTFIDVLGGLDGRAPAKSLEQQKADLMNLEIFLKREMEDFLTYAKRLPEKMELKVPCMLAVGEKDGEGLFSRAGESTARYLGCPLLHVPGYHNFAFDLPCEFAATLSGAFAVM